MAGWHHDSANWKPKTCAVCETEFIPRSGVHKFCSEKCKGKWKYITNKFTTEAQYVEISNNWPRYISRLINFPSRKKSGLSRDDVLYILEKQNYRCALSGVKLTCILKRGVKTETNASIDRINPKGTYNKNNIQLVCAALNSFRRDISVKDYIDWCVKVANHNRSIYEKAS